VVRDPAGTADQLAGFLGTSAAGRRALGTGLARARTSSIGRWREVLSRGQLAEVAAEIGPLLTHLGYGP